MMAVIVIVMVVAGFLFASASGANFARFRTISQVSVDMAEIQETVASFRNDTYVYRVTGDPAIADQAWSKRELLEAEILAARNRLSNDTVREDLSRVDEFGDEYAEAFEQYITRRQLLDEEITAFEPPKRLALIRSVDTLDWRRLSKREKRERRGGPRAQTRERWVARTEEALRRYSAAWHQ